MWDQAADRLEFKDSTYLSMGSDADMVMYHTGGSFMIDNGTGNFTMDTALNNDFIWKHNNVQIMQIDTSLATLFVGGDDAVPGIITAMGGATNNPEGGELRLRTAFDHDSTYNYYFIDAYEDDLRIGRAGNVDITLSSTGALTVAGTIGSGAITSTGAIVGTTIDATTDFTVGSTVITDGSITDNTGLILTSTGGVGYPSALVEISPTFSGANNSGQGIFLSPTFTETNADVQFGTHIKYTYADTGTNQTQPSARTVWLEDSAVTGSGNVVTSMVGLWIDNFNSGASGSGTSLYIEGGGTYALHVSAGTSRFGGIVEFADGSASAPSITNNGDPNTGMFFQAADTIGFALGGSEEFRMESDGDFHADGDVYAFSGTVSSDIALKENIAVIPNALDKVSQLEGVSWDWKDSWRGSSIGLVAQNVEKIFPELVKEAPSLKEGVASHKNLNYNGIIGLLVESIKELKDEVIRLKNGNTS